MCIDRKQVCDGTPQCQDRSDELDCFSRSHECKHQCDNKTRCIPESFLCDGEKDCVDATDEANCCELTKISNKLWFSEFIMVVGHNAKRHKVPFLMQLPRASG